VGVTLKRKDIDSILAEPLTPVRIALAQKLLTRGLAESERDTLVAVVRKTLAPNSVAAFDQEEQKIITALRGGTLSSAPNLSAPELQLLWAAYLTQTVSSGVRLENTPLWKQLLNCDFSRHELMRHAAYIARDQFNTSTRLVWGAPGSMFYFMPSKNSINIA